MFKWLYNSDGDGVAFIYGNNVFTENSDFLGELHGKEIWNGEYIGEILGEDRICRKALPPLHLKGLTALPPLPPLPPLAALKPPILFPVTHEDLKL